MKSEKHFNVLEGFDFSVLSNPEFGEDSVREEIILPIIKGLGYGLSKPHQIVRSRRLRHPFISIGSQRKHITLVPDYLFEVNEQPAWILDAKAPNESVVKSNHVEQAYSYAIHPEVRTRYFALCNGREFALYSIDQLRPVLHFPVQGIPVYWGTLRQYLSPEGVAADRPSTLRKDLGLHLKRLGFAAYESLIFPDVPLTHIAQMGPGVFTCSGSVSSEGTSYVITFDFGDEVFSQLAGKIPQEAITILSNRKTDSRAMVTFADRAYYLSFDCVLGEELQENQQEIFLPLWVKAVVG